MREMPNNGTFGEGRFVRKYLLATGFFLFGIVFSALLTMDRSASAFEFNITVNGKQVDIGGSKKKEEDQAPEKPAEAEKSKAVRSAPQKKPADAASAKAGKETPEPKRTRHSNSSFVPAVTIEHGADTLKKTLENMPYTSEGKGAVVYVFEYSDCAYAQKRHKDWNGKLEGVELRHFFYGTNNRSSNETAALAISRDIGDYNAFMENRKSAPDATKSSRTIDAYNSIIKPVTTVIIPTLQKNGWKTNRFSSPHFIWESDGVWYSDAGYTKEHFTNIVNMAKGVSSPAPSAGSPPVPPPAPAHATNTPPSDDDAETDTDLNDGITAPPAGYRIPGWADKLDIIGVKIGMPAKQVIEIIRKHNPKFEIKVDKVALKNAGEPKAYVIKAAETVSSREVEAVNFRLALPPEPSVVIESTRRLYFNPGDEPPLESVVESLLSKYGKNAVRVNPLLIVWRLDGAKVEKLKHGGCYYHLDPIMPGIRYSFGGYSSDMGNLSQEINGSSRSKLDKECGVVVSARIELLHTNEHLVSRLSVRASSEPYRMDSLRRTSAFLENLDENRKAREVGKQKDKKVKM